MDVWDGGRVIEEGRGFEFQYVVCYWMFEMWNREEKREGEGFQIIYFLVVYVYLRIN